MSLQGTFDPSTESRPAVSYPSSINTLSQSSAEDSLPAVSSYISEFIPSPAGSCTVVRSASTDPAYSGERAIKLTQTNAAFPPNAAPTETGVLVLLNPASYPSGAYVSYRVYPVGTGRLVRDRFEISGSSGSDIGATTSCPAGTWTLHTVHVSAVAIANNAAFNGGTARLIIGMQINVAATSGLVCYFDDVLIANAAALPARAWEPANGEPFYVDGQSWLCTGAGSFQGLTLSIGDLVTVSTSLDYGLVDEVDWIQTDVLADPAAALLQKPIGFVGREIGLGDWRIALQILLPEDSSSRWGIARWGQTIWSGLAWFDLTDYLRGMSWKRGATSVGSRPEVGTAEITLENSQLQFSPWNGISAFQEATIVDPVGTVQPGAFGPGTLMRLTAYSPSGMIEPVHDPENLDPDSPDAWVGVFAGLVSTWDDSTVELGADRFVTITLVETLSSIAQVDEPALSSPVGSDDLPAARIQRLLDAAPFKYGTIVDLFDYQLASTEYELQSTLMAQNRVSELYLTADSVDGVIRSGRDGRLEFYNQYPLQQWYVDGNGIRQGPDRTRIGRLTPQEAIGVDVFGVPYVGDSLSTANDDEVIVNQLSFAFVGGSVRQLSDGISLRLYDPVSFGRSDLICQSTALLDEIMGRLLSVRARLALRLDAVELHSRLYGGLSALLSIDVDDVIDVGLPPLLEGYEGVVEAADVLGMEHFLIPLPAGGVVWTANYSLGLQGSLLLTPVEEP